MINARTVLTTENMTGAITVERTSGMVGVVIVETVSTMILVCTILLLPLPPASNIFLEREIKDEEVKPPMGNGSDRRRESTDMQLDAKPADGHDPTEEDIAAMMGFGGFSTTKV